MHENNSEDILCSGIEFTMISLISKKINVLIIGGGKAALIKAKTFLKGGCRVYVLSKDFLPELKQLCDFRNLQIIHDEYHRRYLYDKHIIVITTNSESINRTIRKNCDELYKLYIDCTNSKDGLCITPCQINTSNLLFGLHTTAGNPKVSVFLSDMIKSELEKYDDFVEFTSSIRNKIKGQQGSIEVLNFICSEDFYFYYKKGKGKDVLDMFYGEGNYL